MPEAIIAGFRCERCEHTWVPRTNRRPTICPKCKTPYWDKPKLRAAQPK